MLGSVTHTGMSMLSHLSLGVRDIGRAITFYDAIGGPLGFERVWTHEGAAGYGIGGGNDRVALFERAETSAAGAGFHLALMAPSRGAVDEALCILREEVLPV